MSFTLESALYVADRRIGPVDTRDPVQPTGHIYRSFGRINDVTFHSLRKTNALGVRMTSYPLNRDLMAPLAASWLS